jgi:hypothetical protein
MRLKKLRPTIYVRREYDFSGETSPQVGLVESTLHNEVGPAPPCAPPYVRCVRICGTLAFLIHSAPDLSLFCEAPPVCVIWAKNLFPFSHFAFQMTSFPVRFPFSVYTYVVLIFFSVLHTL